MDIIRHIAEEMGIRPAQVKAAMDLIDTGNTIPFIARYRKEATGALDDVALRKLSERLTYLRNLEERKAQVIAAIKEQGMLSDDLRDKIFQAATLVAVEDLYRPYRPKRTTRAGMAKEKGLQPLAKTILSQRLERPALEEAKTYVNSKKGVDTPQDALTGAGDIIAEEISDNAAFRERIRALVLREGILTSRAKDPEEGSVYETFYDYSEPLRKMAGYRVLAINRGEKEKKLSVKVEAPEEKILSYLEDHMIRRRNRYTDPVLVSCIKDAWQRLMQPSIERDVRAFLTENAQDGAVEVFKKNLQQLLMQPPIAGKTVLGWDPAFRTGCKLAVVDATGKILDTAVVFPVAPAGEEKKAQAKETVKRLIRKHHVTLISLGNGTASRESEQVIVEILREIGDPKIAYLITNEAGASVYSASALASEELPDYDVGQRSSASIARRVIDPLSELVKIDPKSIGIGQYQHDVNQNKLSQALDGVVEDCVNRVGVDLNTASASLMGHISGISKAIAKNIVVYRETNGRFENRKQLLKVRGLGPKAFEQCAGFMRISGGSEPLDATSIHPESYGAALELLKSQGIDEKDISSLGKGVQIRVGGKESALLATQLGIGEPTLKDIIEELGKPGRDPREDMPLPVLRRDVMEMEDLKEGMILKGTVRNVTDFGAFVDIGVHQDGLVHISRLSSGYVRHPSDVVAVGDVVDVKVLGVDLTKKRISLSMNL